VSYDLVRGAMGQVRITRGMHRSEKGTVRNPFNFVRNLNRLWC